MVEKDNLKEIWKRLINFYQPKPIPSDEFYIQWRLRMQVYDLSDVEEMADHIEENKSRMGLFPALSEFMAIADSIQSNRLGYEAAAAKEAEKKQAEAFWREDAEGNDYGKKCLKLIKSMLGGTITRQDYISEMRNLGMRHEADDLESYCTRKEEVL